MGGGQVLAAVALDRRYLSLRDPVGGQGLAAAWADGGARTLQKSNTALDAV